VAIIDFLEPESVLRALVDAGITTDERLAAALGPARNRIPLEELERALVRHGVTNAAQLAALKGSLSGYPVVGAGTTMRGDVLPAAVAESAMALVVAASTPTVAFVEPGPTRRRQVANALRTNDFEIWVMSAGQFDDWFDKLYAAPVVVTKPLGTVHDVFAECSARRASDVHLQVGRPPAYRVDGELKLSEHEVVTRSWLEREVERLLPARLKELERDKTVDFAVPVGDSRFRVNVGADRFGWTIAGRLLASSIPTMDQINLPQAIRQFVELERGLVLVTGPTGSGKSTTLAALLGHIAQNQSRHLITLEDPIEYVLESSGNAIVNQRELGESFTSFTSALKQALRQDPDVILVGEMRDPETAKTAVTAAETGHLVFSTLHTYDAQSSLARLIAMYPPAEQGEAREKLAYIVKGVVSQTLVARASGSGRIAAQEIMVSTPAIQNNLRSEDGLSKIRSTIQTSENYGMQTMEKALALLVLNGQVTREAAEFKARDKAEFERYLSTLN
jgi:twitching motility protein PilT